MKRLIVLPVLLLLLLVPSCDAGALEFTLCTAEDDVLRGAFTNPKRAVKYLDALIEANEQGERVDDTIDLAKRIRKCIEPLANK